MESGYYKHRKRTPSERSIRHAMLTELIDQIHAESRSICDGTPGPRRVHPLPRVLVGHNQVELLMRRTRLQGLTARLKRKRIRGDNVASDLVERTLTRSGPDQL